MKRKFKEIKKVKLHPALVFLLLTFIVMIISSVGGILNIESSYYTVNPVSGELETKIVKINNLLEQDFNI